MSIPAVYAHYERSQRPLPGAFKYCPHCRTELTMRLDGGVDRPACSACGYVQHRNPAPTVSVLVVDDDQVLLGKRLGRPGKGLWSLPSGYIDYEEDFITTAVRETREETGLEVRVESVIHLLSSFYSPSFHFLALYLLARPVSGEPVAGDDLEVVDWFPLSGPWPELAFQEDADLLEWYARQRPPGLPIDDRSA